MFLNGQIYFYLALIFERQNKELYVKTFFSQHLHLNYKSKIYL